MSRILTQSRTKHVSSTPSSPPPLYSFHPPQRVGSTSTTSTPLPSPTSSLRLSAPLVFSTPPQSPPHNGSSNSSNSFLFPRLHTGTPRPSPHVESSLPFLSTVELSPPPEHHQSLPEEEHDQEGVEAVEHLASMGKKSASAKKKGKAKAKAKAKALSSTPTSTPAPPAPATTGVRWSERQQHDAVKAPVYTTTSHGAHKHKGKKHEIHYAQDYEEDLAAEEGYYDEHFELDERRGRSTRPRLLWRSHLDPLTLGVLDSHVVEVRGTKVPRLTGEGSVEGKKWSRELEKCGL